MFLTLVEPVLQSQRKNVSKKKEENFDSIIIVATMEFTATTTTLIKKLSNNGGYDVSNGSTYDGVFATPIKHRALSFSSQFNDYHEIF